MKDPNDTRDITPRAGSPLWIHLAVVSVLGFAVLCLAMASISLHQARGLAASTLLWTIAILIMAGELRPIITPGKSGPDAGVASLTFTFAALLYWGLPVAALLKATSMLIAGAANRKAPFRSVFNAAQDVLALAAAWAVLGLAGIHPAPGHPWMPAGRNLAGVGLAGLAYLAVNFVLVTIAVSLHARAPLLYKAREELPYQAFVNLALLSAAPLVVVVMGRSVLLVLLFLLPLIAVYLNAAVSVQREHQALHDELTGLPNRTMLMRQTDEALAEAGRSARVTGFLLLDLDRFKEVNDTLGHPAGDRLLRIVAHRLTHSVRPGDLVARLGGDEFAVLLPVIRDTRAAREVAVRLRAALAEPIRLDGMTLVIEASVGIAAYPADAPDVELLLQRADVAMYLAKENRSGVEAYDPARDRNSPARLTLLGDLRRALDRGEVELHFQPKAWLADGRTAGVEAFARWRHPDLGVISSDEFTKAAGQSELMRGLTRHLVDAALDQASRWRGDGLPVQVSLNVSARDLLDAELTSVIARGLDSRGLPPEALMLEINEQVLTAEPDHAAATVDALAALGLSVGLDDFGTGYSSLVRLKRLPVCEVKIDSSFVRRLTVSHDDEVIVRSLVNLVHALGIRSVAKGVDSAATARALRAMDCDVAQGPYVSRPLSPASATSWLRQHMTDGAGRPDGTRPGRQPRRPRSPARAAGRA